MYSKSYINTTNFDLMVKDRHHFINGWTYTGAIECKVNDTARSQTNTVTSDKFTHRLLPNCGLLFNNTYSPQEKVF